MTTCKGDAMDCPKCDWEQQDGMDECSKCGVIFSKVQDPSTTKYPGTVKRTRVVFLYAAIFLVVIGLYAGATCLGQLLVTPDPPKISWRKRDSSPEAAIMMQNFVKDRLKAPASADFKPGYRDSVTRIDGQRYRVISWVDSQNSFGAKLRNHYIGEIEQIEKDHWNLVSLEFAKGGWVPKGYERSSR
jgi:hypothetical protein